MRALATLPMQRTAIVGRNLEICQQLTDASCTCIQNVQKSLQRALLLVPLVN
jgi:hypothetical protein